MGSTCGTYASARLLRYFDGVIPEIPGIMQRNLLQGSHSICTVFGMRIRQCAVPGCAFHMYSFLGAHSTVRGSSTHSKLRSFFAALGAINSSTTAYRSIGCNNQTLK